MIIMKKIVIVFLALFVFVVILVAQLNDVQILLNQARAHENRNQLSQALEIYEGLYENHPSNENVVESYLRVLFLRSDFTTVRSVLDNSRNLLPALFLTRHEVMYSIRTNNIPEAEKIAFDWINRNRRSVNLYTEFARIFESAGLFDTVIQIYTLGRSALNNDELFTQELSNAHYYQRNHTKFFEEAINFLRMNPGFLYYYRNRFNEFLASNPENIDTIESFIMENDNDQIYELFAFSLVEVKNFQRAVEIFDRLPMSNMLRFADDLRADKYIDLALETYVKALSKTDNQAELAEIKFKIAEIYFEKNDLESSIFILNEIINNEELQTAPSRNRTNVNTQSRLLMALISMHQDADILETRQWFESASTFAVNVNDKSDILFRLSRFLYLNKEYLSAFQVIEQAIGGQRSNTTIYKQSYFYRYEIALFQNSAERDSLLTECLIYFPEDPRITDMLFLETFLNNLDDASKSHFLEALRFKGLYKDSLAVKSMLDLAEKTRIEELLILAHEWAKDTDLKEYINKIYEYEFRNPVLKDFMFLHTIRQNDNVDERRGKISDFLNHNPQNVFSPQLRMILIMNLEMRQRN